MFTRLSPIDHHRLPHALGENALALDLPRARRQLPGRCLGAILSSRRPTVRWTDSLARARSHVQRVQEAVLTGLQHPGDLHSFSWRGWFYPVFFIGLC